MSDPTPPILSEKRGALGLLTLNRPRALNALSHDMIKLLRARLEAWAVDQTIACVAIRGAGRGFCAGGDIRAVREAVIQGSDAGAALLADEYHLNALIGAYPKPYVALVHGVCMGGGAGVSVHGRLRLADASLTFAMPETAIGFIPDVGASHFLSRLPEKLGLYLGFTGLSIPLGDALAAGLMTHAVAQEDFEAVIEALAKGGEVERAIAPFTRKPPPASLPAHRIATLFSAGSVEAVLERLDREGGDFAHQTAAVIRSRSPTSLKLVFRQLQEASKLNLRQCLSMEYRLALRVLQTPDFREGVRAALVDKDRNPHWQPSALAGVGDLEGFFASLGQDELF